MPMPLIDLHGQRFGMLQVLSRAPYVKGDAKWNCICDCGKPTIVASHNLRDGNTKSCGCWRVRELPERQVDLTGRRFGRLTALSMVPRGERRNNRRWLCRCDCGAEKVIRSDRLVRGETISCGCAVAGPFVVSRPDDIRKVSAARDRRALGTVTAEQIEDLYQKQRGRCPNCGDDLKTGYHRDHIIPVSRGGLTLIANIQLLCIPCNRRKYNKMPWEFAREQGRLL